MPINAKGLALIKEFEGCRLTTYKCSAGKLTIGFGHTGDDVHPGMKITQAQADALLRHDLAAAEAGVMKAVGLARTNENQFAAMASLAFNIGLGGFAKTTVLRKHVAGLHAAAANAFILWVNVTRNGKLVEQPGLVRRRLAEKALYLEQIA
jgi:lysozyme